jgi:beta-lactamase regulating signal transducer with metallopeptidase domain
MSRFVILYLAGLTLRSLIFAVLAGLMTFRMRSVASRHAVWTAVLGLLILMPVADAILPAAMIPESAPEIVLPVQTFSAAPTVIKVWPVGALPSAPAAVARDWWRIAVLLWVVIGAALLCRLVLACFAIARMKRRSVPVSLQGWDSAAPALRESGAITVPLTIGLRKPVLILPMGWRDWENWKLRAVLAHELTHVRRRDWAIAVTASFARCAFWFNPLSWWLECRLSALAEQASDEACVQATGDAPRYAETLLQFAAVAKHGRRWMGGVAMAQYKISSRIERVLRLQRAGSGVLSRTGWVAVWVVVMPALYVSAAVQSSTRAELPSLSPSEIIGKLAALQAPVPPPAPPPPVINPDLIGEIRVILAPVEKPQNPAPAPVPQPAPALPVLNPDLIGEIKLILAPVDQVQNAPGNNRYAGNAVWNFRNSALNPNTWANARTWLTRNNEFAFALTAVQGRTVSFETPNGTFSYGCTNCPFVVSETGVAAASSNARPGIVFQLSADGKSIKATCQAVECRIGAAAITESGTLQVVAMEPDSSLKESQSREIPLPPLTCLGGFGTVKADGTPLTAQDCAGGVLPPRVVRVFAVTR